MKKDTLSDKSVKSIMKNYILVYVDYDNNQSIAKKFGVQGLPAYAITNMHENKLKSDGGYLSARDFYKWLENPSMYVQPGEDATPIPEDRRPETMPHQRQPDRMQG